MEAARTKELLSRLLPEGRLRLCDIGGGIGYYADWLAGLGHEVTLVELAPSAVEYARAHQTAPYRAETGDARDLSLLECGSMDAALLMGPLYHLLEREERLLALREAHRMLKPGGLLIAAGISKFSSATWAVSVYGEKNDFLDDEVYFGMLEGKTGIFGLGNIPISCPAPISTHRRDCGRSLRREAFPRKDCMRWRAVSGSAPPCRKNGNAPKAGSGCSGLSA